jgi:hypothetical protein
VLCIIQCAERFFLIFKDTIIIVVVVVVVVESDSIFLTKFSLQSSCYTLEFVVF